MPDFTDEQRQSLQERFQQFDRDRNGLIDREEFRRLIASLGASLNDRETERAFADLDKDGSGHIEFEEFCGWWRFTK
jgi:Ca2+-binding EF-hand superfamily protein